MMMMPIIGFCRAKACLILTCLACLLSWPVSAYYVDFNGTISPYAYTSPSAPLQYTLEIVLLKLGVDAGGQIGIDINLRPGNTVAIAVVYSYVQIVDVLQSTSFKHPNYPSYGRAEIVGDSSVTFEVPERNRYYLVIYTPSNAGDLTYKGRATIMNPRPLAKWDASGNAIMTHLAVEDYYMPVSAYTSTALFVVSAALWFWRIRPSRVRARPVQHPYLPRLITMTILAHLAASLLSLIYYLQYETVGWTDHDIELAQKLTNVVANALFLGLLMLTAMGYTVSRVLLPVRERQLLALAFSTLIIFSSLHAGCPKSSNDDLCMSFFLGVQVVKFLITFSVILQLHNQIDMVRDTCQSQHATSKAGLVLVLAGYRKLQLLEIFRWVILSYLALPVAFLFGSFSLLSWVDENWLPTVAESASTWAVLLSLGWAMSPGKRCILDGAPVPPSPSEADVLDASPAVTAASPVPPVQAPVAAAPRVPERSNSVTTRADTASEDHEGSQTAILRTAAVVGAEDEQEVELSGHRTPMSVAESEEEEEEEGADESEAGRGTNSAKLKKLRSSPSLKGGSS